MKFKRINCLKWWAIWVINEKVPTGRQPACTNENSKWYSNYADDLLAITATANGGLAPQFPSNSIRWDTFAFSIDKIGIATVVGHREQLVRYSDACTICTYHERALVSFGSFLILVYLHSNTSILRNANGRQRTVHSLDLLSLRAVH